MRLEPHDNKQSARKLIRLINISAVMVAMLVAFALPSLYFFDEHTGEDDEVATLAATHAAALTEAI